MNLKTVEADERLYDPDILRCVDAVIDLASLFDNSVGKLDSVKTWSIIYLGKSRTAILTKRMASGDTCCRHEACTDSGTILSARTSNPLATYAKATSARKVTYCPWRTGTPRR